MRKSEQFVIPYTDLNAVNTKESKAWNFVYEWMDSLVFAFITILLVFTFLFRIVGVKGTSMVPTLQNGNWLAVRAINTEIQRGDIVVVTQPNALNEPIIKRVIGLSGDKININFETGEVTVNGTVLNEPYIAEPTHHRFDVTFPVTVPPGCVFVMGDNRNDSLDSRSSVIGFIDCGYILGVAEFRIIPFGDWKLDTNA